MPNVKRIGRCPSTLTDADLKQYFRRVVNRIPNEAHGWDYVAQCGANSVLISPQLDNQHTINMTVSSVNFVRKITFYRGPTGKWWRIRDSTLTERGHDAP